jgi:hypothetical protein
LPIFARLRRAAAAASARPLAAGYDKEALMLNLSQRAELGRAAIDAGCADRDRKDERTAATDAITNILHGLAEAGEEEPELILSSAATHYFVEREGQWRPVEHDEGVFYLESTTERIGPYSRRDAYTEADRLNGRTSRRRR